MKVELRFVFTSNLLLSEKSSWASYRWKWERGTLLAS